MPNTGCPAPEWQNGGPDCPPPRPFRGAPLCRDVRGPARPGSAPRRRSWDRLSRRFFRPGRRSSSARSSSTTGGRCAGPWFPLCAKAAFVRGRLAAATTNANAATNFRGRGTRRGSGAIMAHFLVGLFDRARRPEETERTDGVSCRLSGSRSRGTLRRTARLILPSTGYLPTLQTLCRPF